MSFRAVVVAGDKKGKVGIGIDKGRDVSQAIDKATRRAKKDLVSVVIVDGTIPHEAIGKFGAGKVMLKPASPGTGLIAGGGVRAILESAGVKDVLTKQMGSSNPHNVVKATLAALMSIRDPKTIAAARGISLQELFQN